jgi:GWxTD domain-containing protein
MDAAYFLDNGAHVLDIYFLICNDGLQFVRADGGYRASADLMVVLLDRKGRQVAGDTYRIKLSTSKYRETTAVDSCHDRVMSFRAVPGQFKMVISVFDGDSRRKSVIDTEIDVSALDEGPALSDIVLLDRSRGKGVGPRWPGFEPNVRRTYRDVAKIPFFYEVYAPGEDSVRVMQQLLDGDGLPVHEFPVAVKGGDRIAHLDSVPVDSLANGSYGLRIALEDGKGKSRVMRSKPFEVLNEGLYFGKDVEGAAALLTYIASAGWINAFSDADTEERKRMWEEFWREKDPTPGTPKNEFYEEHLRRFRYADKHFSISLTQGWRTDRGRIYILYGEPDEIDSYPMEVSRNPMEVWFYFGSGKRFVFVDETGFGDFILVREY